MNRWLKRHWRVVALIAAGAILGATAEHTTGHRVVEAIVRALGQLPPTPGEEPPTPPKDPPTGFNHPRLHLKGDGLDHWPVWLENEPLKTSLSRGNVSRFPHLNDIVRCRPEWPHERLELAAPGAVAWMGRVGTETRRAPAVSRAYIAEGTDAVAAAFMV